MSSNRERRQRAFLAAYRECGQITLAAEVVGVGRTSHYRWLEADAEYQAAFEAARAEAADLLEDEARRRAVEGVKRYKFDRYGNPIAHPETGEPYVEHEYSDTLLIFLLKGAKPERYRERQEITGAGGGPLRVENALAAMSMAELAALRRELMAAALDGVGALGGVPALPAVPLLEDDGTTGQYD